MILSFGDQSTEDIFNGVDSKAARKIAVGIHRVAGRKLDMINAAHCIDDLKAPPGNRLEYLKGNLAGYFSIRVNDQFRIIFKLSQSMASDVRIIDYH